MLIIIDARVSGTTTGRYIDKLIENIAKINPDHDFNIITKPHRVEYFKKIAPKYYVFETTAKEFTFAEQIEFLKLVKSTDADLVHYGMTQQPIFYRGDTVTTIHDLIMTKKEFIDPHKKGLVIRIKQFVYKWVVRLAADKSNLVITPTEYIKKDVMKFTGQSAKKFVVTPEAADKIKEKADPYKKLVGKKFLMYTGQPMPHKNLNRLIEAFEILQVKYPDLYLSLSGPKDLNYDTIENEVKKSGIKNIIFTGWVSDGELRWLYENCAAYIFPSLSEGFGLPGLEAMMHGAPVVSSNATCLPEVYGDAAKYFDPTDIGDIADSIVKVLDDEMLRKDLIKKGYKRAAKYSWDKMAKQTLEVYNRILKP